MKGNIRMDKFDQYKRLLRLGIAGIEIFIETLFFVYVWNEVYRELRVTMFLNKGNWMMIGFYVLYLIVFVYLYGGTKYAYYKKGQLILSQTLGTIIANALMYIQIIMVVGRFPFPTIWPMLVMSAADLVVIMLINQLSDGIFKKMFPPKRLLLICDMAYKENLIRKLSEDIDRVQASGKKAFYVFPFIFRQQTSLFYEKIMPELKKLPLDGIMVRSLDEIAFIKEWGNENWQMVSDSNLYTYSNEAAEYFYRLGMMQDTIPVELNRKEILRRENSRSEMIIYGRLPLMITAQCIHKNTLGCMHQHKVLNLKDRYSVHFPVKNFCPECYNVIYNSLPVCLFKEDATVKKIAPAAVRLSFTTETEEETEQILTIYGDIYKNGGILGQLPMKCTNGHFKRGVE